MPRKLRSGKPPVDTYYSDVRNAAHKWLLDNNSEYRKNFTRLSRDTIARQQTARLLKAQAIAAEPSLES